MSKISNITRPQGDPQVLSTGPSSLGTIDQLGRALGWFSLGLGALELLAPRSITRALGIQGREDLVRLYGARELGSGMLSLSLEKDAGLWSRVAGDGLDIVSVATAYRRDNPKRGNIGLALVVLAGVTVLDVVVAQGVLARHRRKDQPWRDYSHRTGFPQGLASARQVATTESKGKAKGKSGQPALAKT